jgi:hypothetical protein
MRFPAFLAVVSLVLGCATRPMPELPVLHPASPAAAEAPPRPAGIDLSSDEAARMTEQLLAPPQSPQ